MDYQMPTPLVALLCVSPMQALRFHTVSSGGPYDLPSALNILLQYVRKRHGLLWSSIWAICDPAAHAKWLWTAA